YPKYDAKAAIMGNTLYDDYGDFKNNMGDPRMSHYYRLVAVGENSYPSNISPNRRNVRRRIYDDPLHGPQAYYTRVLPSEWPDRGHDSSYAGLGGLGTSTSTAINLVNTYPMPSTSMPVPGSAPQRISNEGRFYSVTELGNIYDPVMWSMAYDDLKNKPGSGKTDTALLNKTDYPKMPTTRNVFPDVTNSSGSDNRYGGGNTLRIGRYEHKRFDVPGQRASDLAELFHTGKSTSTKQDEREGDVIDINGNININTASTDTLRAMIAGMLSQDPILSKVTNWKHDPVKLTPQTKSHEMGTPTRTVLADKITEAIELRRPFATLSELSAIKNADEDPVFGNLDLYDDGKEVMWTDAAAEELFARVHDAGTLRSRNFRVWVVGQSLGGSEQSPEVLAETRRVYTVFADPGERDNDGSIRPENNRSRVTYESDF
ncbi:MAG TPA: hypothetical protein VM511_06045, partial [Luteolibacter sp.]|nr:hypothetical protein [Luteolibacter sp.]